MARASRRPQMTCTAEGPARRTLDTRRLGYLSIWGKTATWLLSVSVQRFMSSYRHAIVPAVTPRSLT
jgi:hypothetical protein